MGNQAATLASNERRKIARVMREIAKTSAMLIIDLDTMLPRGDVEPVRVAGVMDQLLELNTLVSNALAYSNRWLAFVEVSRGD